MADKELTFFQKYLDIVQKLVVPKLRDNEFGGFNYRSIEDIEEKLKPLLKEHELALFFSDDIIEAAGSAFVKATALLTDGTNELSNVGVARLAEKPKAKTDDAQLTGGASSYSRKYAAQGLFLIDDGLSDPDKSGETDATAIGVASLSKAKAGLYKAFKDAGITDSISMVGNIEQAIGKDSVDTVAEVEKVVKHLKEDR